MIWQRIRRALLSSIVAMTAALPLVRAENASANDAEKDCSKPATPAPAPAPGPAMQTIRVVERVPEYYQATRTVYRMEPVQEKYTAYKIEHVPETRTRTVTYYEKVNVIEKQTRTKCITVPTMETRTVMEKHWVCKTVTCTRKKCVDQGHWVYKEVPCNDGLRGLFRKCKKDDCCDPCACPPTKTVKVWCPKKVWIEEPYTKTERVCELRPVTKTVCVHKKQLVHETVDVCVTKCVPKTRTETYTVCVEKKTPYEAVRTVCKCVPHQETYTACRMVCRTVEKQVPVCDPCCEPCKRSRKCCK